VNGAPDSAGTLVSSSGVSMYITTAATAATLRLLAGMVADSIVVMTFMPPFGLVDDADRRGLEGAARGARLAGTPWISLYAPAEVVTLANEAGFAEARYVSTAELGQRYLAGRGDGLRASSGEAVLLART
jgi:O-methyltransferase involved in polyketide biosynthesis